MQIRDNVRERRRERIQQIMGQQSKEEITKRQYVAPGATKMRSSIGEIPNTGRNFAEVTKSEPELVEAIDLEGYSNPSPTMRYKPPSTRVLTSDDPDPELWWKEREKRVKERDGNWQGLKGLPPTSQPPKASLPRLFDFNKFMVGFTWRMVGAAILFAAVWGWFKLELPGSEEAHKWMVTSVTRDMDFEAIEVWYGENFGGSPSFFPFNQDKSVTEAVTARLSPEETIVPVVGRVIQSFTQNGTGIKVSAVGGSDVVSIFTGRVQQVTQDSDGGVTILVQHPNQMISVYGSLENAAVKPNDWVETGHILGQLEAETDREATLFFAVQENGKTIDPADVVTFD